MSYVLQYFSIPWDGTYIPSHGTAVPAYGIQVPPCGTEIYAGKDAFASLTFLLPPADGI